MESKNDVARELARAFYTLSPTALNELAEILVPFKYAKGDRVLNEGEVCKYMLFVHKGIVRQFYFKNNKDVTEHFSYEGRLVVCIESFFKQEPTRLMVEALEPSVLYGIPHDAIEALADRNREINLFYRHILEHALIRSQVAADRRRFESAQERYNYLLSVQPEIFLRAPLVHIASYLQMAPETLSRVRAAAQEQKEAAKQEEVPAKREMTEDEKASLEAVQRQLEMVAAKKKKK
jgi:CRP-like cAMP-binding protein